PAGRQKILPSSIRQQRAPGPTPILLPLPPTKPRPNRLARANPIQPRRRTRAPVSSARDETRLPRDRRHAGVTTMTTEAVPQRVLDQIALSREEYARVCEVIGRTPNDVELGMFGALWSEHCGYK